MHSTGSSRSHSAVYTKPTYCSVLGNSIVVSNSIICALLKIVILISLIATPLATYCGISYCNRVLHHVSCTCTL